MSDKKTVIGDKMIEEQLNEYSQRLNISLDDLIERYIRRGLFSDDYYKPSPVSIEELKKLNKIELERERKMGLKPPKKHRFDNLINLRSKSQ